MRYGAAQLRLPAMLRAAKAPTSTIPLSRPAAPIHGCSAGSRSKVGLPRSAAPGPAGVAPSLEPAPDVEVSPGLVTLPGSTSSPIGVTWAPCANAQSSRAAVGRQLPLGLPISVTMEVLPERVAAAMKV